MQSLILGWPVAWNWIKSAALDDPIGLSLFLFGYLLCTIFLAWAFLMWFEDLNKSNS